MTYDRFNTLQQINLVRKVSTKQPFHVSSGTGDMHVALIDCGVKENILRSLVGRGKNMKTFVHPFIEGEMLTSKSFRLLRDLLSV